MTLFIGIDISLKDFKVRVIDPSGREIGKRFKQRTTFLAAKNLLPF